jgi:hypothetical protein
MLLTRSAITSFWGATLFKVGLQQAAAVLTAEQVELYRRGLAHGEIPLLQRPPNQRNMQSGDGFMGFCNAVMNHYESYDSTGTVTCGCFESDLIVDCSHWSSDVYVSTTLLYDAYLDGMAVGAECYYDCEGCISEYDVCILVTVSDQSCGIFSPYDTENVCEGFICSETYDDTFYSVNVDLCLSQPTGCIQTAIPDELILSDPGDDDDDDDDDGSIGDDDDDNDGDDDDDDNGSVIGGDDDDNDDDNDDNDEVDDDNDNDNDNVDEDHGGAASMNAKSCIWIVKGTEMLVGTALAASLIFGL